MLTTKKATNFWKYWTFVRGIRRLPVHSLHKGPMMTSSNGNIFRLTGPLCGEFTGPGEFPTQRPVTRGFDVFFDLRLNKRLSKQPWGWWFETPSWSLWRHCNAVTWKAFACHDVRMEYMHECMPIVKKSEFWFDKLNSMIGDFTDFQ